MINHLLIMYKIPSTIGVVHGIISSSWRFKIIPKSIIEGFSIYSLKYFDVLCHGFQGLGLVLWIDGRYDFWFLVRLFYGLLLIKRFEIVYLNISMLTCVPNPLGSFDVI